MKTIRSPRQMQSLALAWRRAGKTVGLVPTMGALHEGHLSLVRRARAENEIVVVSIFVNPAQFGPKEDYLRYPRPFAKDKRLCERAGVNVVFSPSPSAMYAEGHDTWVTVEKLSRPLCGAFRPGHFRGVATVVAKLFNLVQPARAYFGMKDFQQMCIIERMAEDLHMPVKIVRCPILRDPGGLALSSRNAYLAPQERQAARNISLALRAAEEVIKSHARVPSAKVTAAAWSILRKIPGMRLDYLSVADPATLEPLALVRGRALVAAALWIGNTRLIDNRLVRN
ncbi:MAG: pantoate--beta-alanine ligase [Elusimicrobia bacterium]|nr:pantoate--beta-alanine ligase [Elusimicrobiota bacterium]